MAHSADAEPEWFKQAITPIKILLAKTRNQQLHDGEFGSFEIVPFIDGSMPDDADNDLPLLINMTAIRNLSAAEATSYCNGYGLANAGGVLAKKKQISRFIGCGVSVD